MGNSPLRRVSPLVIAIMLSAGVRIPFDAVQAQGHPARRALEKTPPVYPDLAKRAQIRGIVKMEVVVRANGSVKSVKILGGNAALLDSAVEAIHKWKFELTAQDTIEVVQITFEPH